MTTTEKLIEKLLAPCSVLELALCRFIFGKTHFPIRTNRSTRCGDPASRKTCKQKSKPPKTPSKKTQNPQKTGTMLLVSLAELESRTQGSRPRPRTQKNFEAKAKDRPSQGHGPRTQTQVFSKKNVFKIFFQAISKKKVFKNFFSRDLYLRRPKKGLCRFSARFLRFPTKFQRFKNSAVLQPRTGQFSRT